MSNAKTATDLEAIRELGQLLCTCQGEPLGLPFTLTFGCLFHDRCVCAEKTPRRQKLVPAVGEKHCGWCSSYVCLLQALADLPALVRVALQQRYLQLHSGG